jgi:hypothetical protein
MVTRPSPDAATSMSATDPTQTRGNRVQVCQKASSRGWPTVAWSRTAA